MEIVSCSHKSGHHNHTMHSRFKQILICLLPLSITMLLAHIINSHKHPLKMPVGAVHASIRSGSPAPIAAAKSRKAGELTCAYNGVGPCMNWKQRLRSFDRILFDLPKNWATALKSTNLRATGRGSLLWICVKRQPIAEWLQTHALLLLSVSPCSSLVTPVLTCNNSQCSPA